MPTPSNPVTAHPAPPTPDDWPERNERMQSRARTHEDINATWEAEIARRIARIDAGEAEFIPWETFVADLRAQRQRSA